MKLWKVVQPQVQLMSINVKFEVTILWLFQVQIITNIVYKGSIMEMLNIFSQYVTQYKLM